MISKNILRLYWGQQILDALHVLNMKAYLKYLMKHQRTNEPIALKFCKNIMEK